MKRKYSILPDCVYVLGIRGVRKRKGNVDFYIVHPVRGREYAFTRRYTHKVYELTKGGMAIKELLGIRSADEMTMALVKQLSYMMPYFMDEIEWLAA